MTAAQRPPAHLTRATKAWWKLVVDDYQLEAHQLRTLTLAAEAWDRCQQAREQIAKDGLTVKDRFGQVKTHPLVAVERDARLGFVRCVRELALEVDEEPAESRPPRIRAVK